MFTKALIIFAGICMICCTESKKIDIGNLPSSVGKVLVRNNFHLMTKGDTIHSNQLTNEDQAVLLEYIKPMITSAEACGLPDLGFYVLDCGSCTPGCSIRGKTGYLFYNVGSAIYCKSTNKFVVCMYCYPGSELCE
jgi:hypothetical protein